MLAPPDSRWHQGRGGPAGNSPAYYLQQNDVVYVEPNKVRAGQSTINENNLKSVSLWVSIGSFLSTLATLFISLFAGRGSAN